MRCPNCGTENHDGAKYCFQCGTPIVSVPQGEAATQAAGYGAQSPAAGYATSQNGAAVGPQQKPHESAMAARAKANAAQVRPQKKRSVLPVVIGLLVFVVIGVFAGFALGFIPRFWQTDESVEENHEFDEFIVKEGGVSVPALMGKTEDEARGELRDLGLDPRNTTYVYSFAVEEGSSVVVSSSPDSGVQLAEGAPVDLVVACSPNLDVVRNYVKQHSDIASLIKENPQVLVGEWRGELTDPEPYSSYGLPASKCDAAKDHAPRLAITSTDGVAMNADVSLQLLLHEHGNGGNARHFSEKDDTFISVAEWFNDKMGIVMGLDNDGKLYWSGSIDKTYFNDAGEEKSVNEQIHVYIILENDLDLNDPDAVADLLGDDAEKQFESEEEAQSVLEEAILAERYPVLLVGQFYGRDKRGEAFRLSRKDGSPALPKEDSAKDVQEDAEKDAESEDKDAA